MTLLEQSKNCYRDQKGNIWISIYVKYQSTTGDPDDYDEVIQIKKNGIEQGRLTCHCDKQGNIKVLQEKGNVNLPVHLEEISCD